MMLIDTSILVSLFRDRTGRMASRIAEITDGQDVCLSRFTQMELLQGCRDDAEWLRLEDYLSGQDYAEADEASWGAASRLYFDLRCSGFTVRSVIDCCIATLAMQNELTLLHNDRDFETIAKFRRLKHIRLAEGAMAGFHEDPGTIKIDDERG